MARPRPVLTSAGISGAITSVAGVLTFLGYSEAASDLSAETTTIVSVAGGLILLASHILPALHAQSKVTPIDKPQDAAGNTLAPVTAGTALVSVVPSLPPITAFGDDEPDVEPEPDNDEEAPEIVKPTDEPHLVDRLAGGTAHAAEHAVDA